jgi:hypothetical protein
MTAHAITANPSRYRIEAMAPTAADVVANLGGLLFDRRRLGWDTLVLLDDCPDIRPLQIIGADCVDLRLTLDMPQHPRAAAIATSMQLYRSDPRVYARINAAIDGGLSEVVVWGDTNVTPEDIAERIPTRPRPARPANPGASESNWRPGTGNPA